VVWQANSRRLSVENFDKENVDELIKICQIRQYFPRQKFVPYSIMYRSNVTGVMGGSALTVMI